ncbi:MAG: hypothetical protein FWC50_06110 [Planctomycetaceae bacterium]|nr:hypothetical protein [Planctomycetaceae bacterium]
MSLPPFHETIFFAQSDIVFDSANFQGVPAAFWFIQFFKVLGFVLHILAMNLWFAGLPMALLMLLIGGNSGRRFAKRLISQLPIIMAMGINFGIVPLLFIQTLYYKMFYSATVLMAWHWILVIPLVMIAYYSIYIAAFSLNKEKKGAQTFFAGLISMVCLLAVAYILVNAMSLMGRPDTWGILWEKWQIFGGKDFGAATLGLGINAADPTLWLRYGTMFGLALTTTAFWAVFDAQALIPNRKELTDEQRQADKKYRIWAGWFAILVAILGGAVAVGCFDKYTVLVRTNPVTAHLFNEGSPTFYYLWQGTGLAMFLPFVGLLLVKMFRFGPVLTVLGITLCQLAAIAAFAVSRQWVQNAEISQIVQINNIPENVQLSPLIAFLVLFVIGALVVVWMLRQVAIAPPAKTTCEP